MKWFHRRQEHQDWLKEKERKERRWQAVYEIYSAILLDLNGHPFKIFCLEANRKLTEQGISLSETGVCDREIKARCQVNSVLTIPEADHIIECVWERGISSLTFVMPPVEIDGLRLRLGRWRDNSSITDCYQIEIGCDCPCGHKIFSKHCSGPAMLGAQLTTPTPSGHHFQIITQTDHDCAIQSHKNAQAQLDHYVAAFLERFEFKDVRRA